MSPKFWYNIHMSDKGNECNFTLKNDYLFKRLLGVDENKDVLKDFLECAFDFPAEDLNQLELLDKELKKDQVNDKMGVLDIHIRLKNGTHIDIEMQQIWDTAFIPRCIFYFAKMYIDGFEARKHYSSLRQTVVASIIGKGFNIDDDVHSKWFLQKENSNKRLTDLIEFHFFNLEKVEVLPIMCENTKESRLINWLKFINATTKEERHMLAKSSPMLKSLSDKMDVLTLTSEERYYYDLRKKYKLDMESISESRFNAGIIKGITQGRMEEKLEMARIMKRENCPVSLIVKTTGLPKEEIEKL